ncbi:hypothetical protein LG634_34690 [Streptomyces bambusae]|uniref:hypothetical protein n=1 Tax=Streptomyces bambusae TaxID=1550616 RepID=UPI001CFFD30D|nr:hypothetical protein [Streptomyces bambusae]MCB5169937.1 hypothetical protein [Streptomyces bambusae]
MTEHSGTTSVPSRVRERRQRADPDIEFRPVRNGMDYLLSAVDHLTQEDLPGERSLKYTVLHLHSATEVLLKARLVREHWSLVFKEPAVATRKRFDTGDFSSATLEATIDRLKNIVGIDIGETNRSAITKLSQTRNAFTHYEHSDSAYAVESQATKVLNFLLDFIAEHLYDTAGSQFGEEYHQTMHLIRERLGRIDSLVAKRMRSVARTLQGREDVTVQCPACREYAVAIEEPLRCLFCHADWAGAEVLAVLYVLGVAGEDNAQLKSCPACDYPSPSQTGGLGTTLVLGVTTAASPHTEIGLCFRCAAVLKQAPDPLLKEPAPTHEALPAADDEARQEEGR